MSARPSRSCTSSSSRGTSIIGAPSSRLRSSRSAARSRAASTRSSSQVRTTLRASGAPSSSSTSAATSARCAGTGMRTRLATTPANGSAASCRPLVEEGRLVERVLARRGDHHERAALVGEQRVDLAGPLAEALDHPAEAAEELRQVGEQVHAGGPLHRAEEHAAAAAEQLEAEHARPGEQLERRRVDERGELPRSVEEVERVAGGRRVEHQQVVLALARGARGASPSPCTPATRPRRSTARGRSRLDEHRVARALVGRVLLHQLVEGALRVEHHRPQLALHRRVHEVRLVVPAPSSPSASPAGAPGRS